MSHFIFHDPWWFAALLVFPLVWGLRRRRKVPVLVVPGAAAWARGGGITVARTPVVFVVLGLILFIAALARPQRVEDKRETNVEGYDLMLAIDLSESMLSEDYERAGQRINRLQAIKPVIQAFITRRRNDRIGIVVFAGRAYTLAPLTFDHDWLDRQVEQLKVQRLEQGTAIGDGLGLALTRLEQSSRYDAEKRLGAFVVLLTDGVNNRGALTPEQSTEVARSRSIPVYTIGAGQEGYVITPQFDNQGNRIGERRMLSQLDETSLRTMASQTGGQFFRALDSNTIEKAFAAIDEAQKIEFDAKSYLVTTELFPRLAWPGVGCLFFAGLLVTVSRPSFAARARAAASA